MPCHARTISIWKTPMGVLQKGQSLQRFLGFLLQCLLWSCAFRYCELLLQDCKGSLQLLRTGRELLQNNLTESSPWVTKPIEGFLSLCSSWLQQSLRNKLAALAGVWAAKIFGFLIFPEYFQRSPNHRISRRRGGESAKIGIYERENLPLEINLSPCFLPLKCALITCQIHSCYVILSDFLQINMPTMCAMQQEAQECTEERHRQQCRSYELIPIELL